MTFETASFDFQRRLGQIVRDFRGQESAIRAQYANPAPPAGTVSAMEERGMLERATRRYIIDELLRALDWNPAIPSNVAEEARARSSDGARLYFDYLGVAPLTQFPVLLVEAKAFDVSKPRKARGSELDARTMSQVLATAIEAIKRGNTNVPIHSEWIAYLRDMHSYMLSIATLGRTTLKRLLVTSGSWSIIFVEPAATFLATGEVNAAHIVCFTSLDELVVGARDVFHLLHRPRLVDTLPFALTVAEALELIPASGIGDCYQAVMVTCSSRGALRQQYPCRDIYPALLVNSGRRWFAIVDYDCRMPEPEAGVDQSNFITDIEGGGTALLNRLRRRYDLSLAPGSLGAFPGLPAPMSSAIGMSTLAAPLPGSTTAMSLAGSSVQRRFVEHHNVVGRTAEFVVITGSSWFYKRDFSAASPCLYHSWDNANTDRVAVPLKLLAYTADSSTRDGQEHHCANQDLHSLRANICHLRSFETHLCCKTCIFEFDCWRSDGQQLPCPAPAQSIVQAGN